MCEGFVILKRCEEKKTKNGSDYLDAVIADNTGEMSAKKWDYSPSGLFKQDMIVKVRGTVEQYNGKDQFRIAQIRPVSDSDYYNIADLVPASDIGGEQLFGMIISRVSGFKNPELKAIVTKIMEDNQKALLTHPAAQPLVGMLWLMVRMLAPEEAKIPSTRERTPVLSFSIP